MKSRKLRHRLITAGILVLMVALGVFASVLAYHNKAVVHEGKGYAAQTPGVTFNNNGQPQISFVDINAYLVSVDTGSQTAQVRLMFGFWQQDSSLDSPYTPEQLTVSVLGTVTDPTDASDPTATSYTFNANQQMRSVDVDVNLGNSSAQKYPFDSYTGFIAFDVTDGQGNVVQSATSYTDLADGFTSSLDSDLCDVTNSDWYPFLSLGPNADVCAADNGARTTTGLEGLEIGIHRESVTQIYAIFIMALMWTLALAGVVTVMTVVRHDDLELDFLLPTYLAALLFAFPLIRGLLPGSPDLGVLADFAAYFWVEAVTGISLLVLVICWIKRAPGPSPDKVGADKLGAFDVSEEKD